MVESPVPRAQAPFARDDTARVTRFALVAVFVVVGVTIAAHLIDFGVYDLRVRVMDAGLGSSPVAWVGPAALAVALVATIVLARRNRITVALVPVLAVVLILATRHLGESLPYWQVLLLPPLGLALFLLWRDADRLDPHAGRVCRAGCVLLVCAFALHAFGPAVLHAFGVRTYSWPDQVKIALKEGLEIGGWLLIASALATTAWFGAARRPNRD
ncbi:MAG TPA: hypothetical protein VKB73_04780 [Gaiellaceae bacterium]|nr:hypothetical protein [Gaiellaceae bacterium]